MKRTMFANSWKPPITIRRWAKLSKIVLSKKGTFWISESERIFWKVRKVLGTVAVCAPAQGLERFKLFKAFKRLNWESGALLVIGRVAQYRSIIVKFRRNFANERVYSDRRVANTSPKIIDIGSPNTNLFTSSDSFCGSDTARQHRSSGDVSDWGVSGWDSPANLSTHSPVSLIESHRLIV